MPRGQPRARVHQRDVPLRHRQRDPGRHQRPLPRRQRDVDGGEQVGAGVAGMGVRRQRQVRVEPDHLDRQVARVGSSRGHPRRLGHRDVVGDSAAWTSPTPYAERLSVPLRWWVQGTMLVATLWLALRRGGALDAPPGRSAAIALALMAAVLLTYGSARVEVRDGWFRAGRARIEVGHLGAAEVAGRRGDPPGGGARRRRAGLPAAAALPQARGPGRDHRPGRPGAVLAGLHPPPRRAGQALATAAAERPSARVPCWHVKGR